MECILFRILYFALQKPKLPNLSDMRPVLYFIYFIAIVTLGCSGPSVEDLLNVDREFSEMSVESGMKQAFYDYADDSVVLLQPNIPPVRGKQAMKKLHEAYPDEGFVLSWEPIGGSISGSGDLGYTFGTFKMATDADSIISTGKYVSIWKKQADGSWKFVLDAGNADQ
jgi:ketosteroid isomerase-like protein